MKLKVLKNAPDTFSPTNWSDEVVFVKDFINYSLRNRNILKERINIDDDTSELWTISKDRFIRVCIINFNDNWEKFCNELRIDEMKDNISKVSMLDAMVSKVSMLDAMVSIVSKTYGELIYIIVKD